MSTALRFSAESPPPSFTFPLDLGVFTAFLTSDQPVAPPDPQPAAAAAAQAPAQQNVPLKQVATTYVVKWEQLRKVFIDWKRPAQPPADPGKPPPPAPAFKLLYLDPDEALPQAVWDAIFKLAIPLRKGPTRGTFALGGGQAPISAYDLSYAVVNSPALDVHGKPTQALLRTTDHDLLCGFNFFQRHQKPGIAPSSNPMHAPLEKVGTDMCPYDPDRGENQQFFEHWANTLFAEMDHVNAKNLVSLLLQGRAPDGHAFLHRPVVGRPSDGSPAADPLNSALKLCYRRLPRTPQEVAQRTAERTALVADPLGSYLWLDDSEAKMAIRLMMMESLWIMEKVPDPTHYLRPIGPGYQLPKEVVPTDCFAYHATARAPQDLAKTGTGRAVSFRGASYGLDQTWSPFHPGNGWTGQLLYRRISADNELATTVSVAQSTVTALDFPLLQDTLNSHTAYKASFKPGGSPLADGIYRQPDKVGFELLKGKFHTDTWVYLVAVRDIYDTGELQLLKPGALKFTSTSTESWLNDAYVGKGELATPDIAVPGHLFGARYHRVHYGHTREEGMRYCLTEILPVNMQLWTGSQSLAWEPGKPLPLLFRLFLDQVAAFPMCGVKSSDNMTADNYKLALTEALQDYKNPPAALDHVLDKAFEVLYAVGSTKLHGELPKMRTEVNRKLVLAWESALGDLRRAARDAKIVI